MTLGPALKSIGFAVLTGHGVPSALLDEAHAATEAFFHKVSDDDRRRFAAARKGSVNQVTRPIMCSALCGDTGVHLAPVHELIAPVVLVCNASQ